MNGRDLFVSHSSADAEVARELRSELESAGYACWMAPDDVVGTETWAEQILGAIEACRAMVVLVSANANRSPHVSREVNLALARKRPVLPIRIESVPPEGSLEYLLSLVQRVDAFPPPIRNHRDRVVRRLDAVLRPNATPPPPPDAPPIQDAHPASLSLGPGVVIDDFEIEALLGEGGMGTVYRARQSEPRRAVALKVVRPDHAANAVYRRRFLAEKDTLASLEHPSIVPIYAAGEDRGVLFIAMRLVDGSDLQARIAADGPLSLADTVRILRPIADAIDFAHAAGVIHRDLKPSNIILDRHGRPYLTDFGLGKRAESPTQLTQQGAALGTLEFMAPEQFTGRGDPAIADRIDVYALGCVAYACLAGRPPFVRETPEQLMYAHAHDMPPAARAVRPDLPVTVDAVLLKALAKDPVDRFGTAMELVSALEAAAVAEVDRPAPTPPPPEPPVPVPPPVSPTPGPLPPALPPRPPGPPLSVPTRIAAWTRANSRLIAAGLVVAVVGVVAMTATGIWPGPDPTAPAGASPGLTAGPTTAAPTAVNRQPAPLSFTASAVSPATVELSWSDDPGHPPEAYHLYRDGVVLGTLAADGVRSIVDFAMPSTSYTYAIESVGSIGTSERVEATVQTGAIPSLSDAWLGRNWHVDLTYSATNFNSRSNGEKDEELWVIRPDCEAGPCPGTLAGVHETGTTGDVSPSDGGYEGTVAYEWTDERCGENTFLGDLDLAIAAGSFTAGGTFIADSLTGTIAEDVQSKNCASGFAAIDLALTPAADPDADLRPLLDSSLACEARDAVSAWPSALTQLQCTAGSATRSVSFYLFSSAGSARDALAQFLELRATTGATSCYASPATGGFGPYFRSGIAQGEVACGPEADAPEGATTRIYVWSHLGAGIIGYAKWEDGIALGQWWADARNWLAAAHE